MHTNIYKTDNQRGPTVGHRELYSISYRYLQLLQVSVLKGWGKNKTKANKIKCEFKLTMQIFLRLWLF